MRFVLILHVPEPVLELVVHIEVLLIELDYSHPGHSSRTGILEHVSLEQEVHVGAELDALAVGQGQQLVVVQD